MAHFSQVDTADVILVDPVPGARSISAPVWCSDRAAPLRASLAAVQEPHTSPWNPGAYPAGRPLQPTDADAELKRWILVAQLVMTHK